MLRRPLRSKFPSSLIISNGSDEVPAFDVKHITRTDIVKYAGASGDFNPIHHDELFAIRAGNDRVFAMGMMSAGFLSKMVCDFVGRENLRTFRVRFTSRIWPGDTVMCSGKITRKHATNGEYLIEGEMQAANQRGEATILGTFSAALPSKSA
jgi:acyl dehydratase